MRKIDARERRLLQLDARIANDASDRRTHRRLVADENDRFRIGMLVEDLPEASAIEPAAEPGIFDDAFVRAEALGENRGGLFRAQQRARDDAVDAERELRDRLGLALHARTPLTRQRAVEIAALPLVGFDGYPMS